MAPPPFETEIYSPSVTLSCASLGRWPNIYVKSCLVLWKKTLFQDLTELGFAVRHRGVVSITAWILSFKLLQINIPALGQTCTLRFSAEASKYMTLEYQSVCVRSTIFSSHGIKKRERFFCRFSGIPKWVLFSWNFKYLWSLLNISNQCLRSCGYHTHASIIALSLYYVVRL